MECPPPDSDHATMTHSRSGCRDSTVRAEATRSGRRRYIEILLFRTLFMVLQLCPPIAGRVACRRFFQPRRYRPLTVDHLRAYDIAFNNHQRVRVYEGGEGPGVLVMHGWESSVARLAVLLDALVASGFRVIAFDMPAHGHSPATDTDIVQITDIIMTLAHSSGPFVAAIGHSFGGVCLANAIKGKLEVGRLVLVSTPATLTGMIDKYCRAVGIWRPTRNRLVRAIQERLTSSELEREFDLRHILKESEVPTLVIHDRKDRVVPYCEGEELSRARTGIQLFATDNLGHSGTIRDAQTIDNCISFIAQDVRR